MNDINNNGKFITIQRINQLKDWAKELYAASDRDPINMELATASAHAQYRVFEAEHINASYRAFHESLPFENDQPDAKVCKSYKDMYNSQDIENDYGI